MYCSTSLHLLCNNDDGQSLSMSGLAITTHMMMLYCSLIICFYMMIRTRSSTHHLSKILVFAEFFSLPKIFSYDG